MLPHTPYSPDVAPSDFRLFGPNDEALEDAGCRRLQWKRNVDRAGIYALGPTYKKTVDRDGGSFEQFPRPDQCCNEGLCDFDMQLILLLRMVR
jgi:hypothetical protein